MTIFPSLDCLYCALDIKAASQRITLRINHFVPQNNSYAMAEDFLRAKLIQQKPSDIRLNLINFLFSERIFLSVAFIAIDNIAAQALLTLHSTRNARND